MTTKQHKEQVRQSFLNQNQVNVALVHKGMILPNGERVIALIIHKRVISIHCLSSKVYKSQTTTINNQGITFITL